MGRGWGKLMEAEGGGGFYSHAAASLRLLCVFLRRLANLAFVVTLLQWVMIVCCVHCYCLVFLE